MTAIKDEKFTGQLNAIFRPKGNNKGLHLISLWRKFIIRRSRKTLVTNMMKKRQLATGEEWLAAFFIDDSKKTTTTICTNPSLWMSESNDDCWNIYRNDSYNLYYDFDCHKEDNSSTVGHVDPLEHLAIFSMNSNTPAIDVSNNYHYYNDYPPSTSSQAKSNRYNKRKFTTMFHGSTKSQQHSTTDDKDKDKDMPQEVYYFGNETNLVYV
jgi:hypothetical protein